MSSIKELIKRQREARPEKGKVIGGIYELILNLGSGGYGCVWKARERISRDRKEVAVKFLGGLKAKDENAIEGLKKEFAILKDLSHPHICKIYDFGFDKLFGAYFVSEYIDGRNIFEATEGQSYDHCELLFVQVLRALAYLHSNGIFHFDIKPGNILVSGAGSRSPHAFLIDFGVAALRPPSEAVGTVQYMAPEMILNLAPDHRADIYSLGVVLYEILVRKNPFWQGGPQKTMERHLKFSPPLPSAANSSIPGYFDTLVSRLLQKNPADRYQSAEEVLRDINFLSSTNYEVETFDTRLSYIPAEGLLIGRKEERKELNMCLNWLISKEKEGAESAKRIVSITGPKGIGKTRLLKDLKYNSKLEGINVIDVMSSSEDVIGNAVESLSAMAVETVSGDICEESRPSLRKGVMTKQSPVHLHCDEAKPAKQSRGINRAVFLCIDDYDNIASLPVAKALSSLITSRFINLPLLVVYTALEENSALPPDISIRLNNFTEQEVAEYIGVVARPPESILSNVAKRFMDYTRGYPALVAHLMKRLVKRGFIVDRGGRWDAQAFEDIFIDFGEISITAPLEDRELQGIGSLSDAEKKVLGILSIWEGGREDLLKFFELPGSGIKAPSSLVEEGKGEVGKVIDSLISKGLITFNPINRSYVLVDEYARALAKTVLTDDEIAQLHDYAAQALIKAGLGCDEESQYKIDSLIAYGSDKDKADEALVRVSAYERRHGRAFSAIDRLEKRIKERSGSEKGYVGLLLELGEAYFHVREFDRAVRAYERALSGASVIAGTPSPRGLGKGEVDPHALSLRSPHLKLNIYQRLCRALIEKCDFKRARSCLEEALSIPGEQLDRVITKNILGRLLLAEGNYKEAVELFYETRREALMLPADQRKRVDNNEYGEALRQIGRYEDAIKELEKDAIEFEEERLFHKAASSRFALAEALRMAGRDAEAELNLKKAVGYAKESQNIILMACIYNGLASLLMAQKRSVEAVEELKKGLRMAFRTGDMGTAAAMMVNIGQCFNDLREFGRAKRSLSSVLAYLEGPQEKPGWVLNLKCHAYLELGDIARQEGELDEARNYIKMAWDLAKEKEELRCYREPILKIMNEL